MLHVQEKPCDATAGQLVANSFEKSTLEEFRRHHTSNGNVISAQFPGHMPTMASAAYLRKPPYFTNDLGSRVTAGFSGTLSKGSRIWF